MQTPLWAIARFDFMRRLRMLSTWVYLVMYAVIAGLWMAAAGGALRGAAVSFGGDKILINGTNALAIGIAVLGFTGVMVIGSVCGRAIQQDFDANTHHFFFSAPISKRAYFFGRLLGAWATLLLIFAGVAAGALVGTHWPGVDPARVLASPDWQNFARPYLFVLIPNMLWLGGIFFTLAALTRQMAPVYVAGVIALVGYVLSLNLISDMENKTLAALIDPSAATAVDVLTRYWSVAQKNTTQIPLAGPLLWNRALWVGVGVVVTLWGYRRFRMEAMAPLRARRARADAAPADAPQHAAALPRAATDRSAAAFARMLPGLVRLYLGEILRSPRFLTIVGGGMLLVVGNAFTLGSFYGTNTYPLTYKVLDAVSGLFGLFVLIVTAIYTGELVWRERDARMDDIGDSMPAPTWLPFLAKFATVLVLQVLLMAAVMACSIAVQLVQGFTRIEVGQYLMELFVIQLSGYALVAVLALVVHTLVNNKYLGHFVVGVVFLVGARLPDFGFENRLYLYASSPPLVYSDMNGWGHFLPAVFWFRLYWSAFAVLLLVLAYALWVRGRDEGWRGRWRGAAARMRPAAWRVAGVAAIVFVATGGWVYYNTHVLNPFVSRYAGQQRRAEFERRFKPLAGAPQPRITAVDVRVDLVPEQHRVRIAGTLTLVNKTTQAIRDLYVVYPTRAQVHRMELGVPARLADEAPTLYWHHYAMSEALAPGASTELRFDIEYAARGFANGGADPVVLDNGSFLNAGLSPQTTLIPSLGYAEEVELASDRERRDLGLPPKPRMHDLDDPRQVLRNGLTRDADFIDYRARFCTAADQLPVTTGYVERDWVEDGRRCLAYRMDSKMAAIYPFVSARYEVRRDTWRGPEGDVAIEIDYQRGHEYNVDRMVAGVKDSLDYFTQHFGPYQHRIVRVIEFPRFSRAGGFAESFPNTIPFNEAIGFTAKVNDRDPQDIDYPYFVTAHEVAHQWWAHQEIPANVQGAEFITESLAEYSALMVLKHKFGDAKMRRFLKYELDRYLLGRGSEAKEEQPLVRADGAAYVHYQKGGLTLYALQDVIGEAALSDALAAFVKRWRFAGPPYPRSVDLLAEFRRVTPAPLQPWITDLFETITLFDLRAVSAAAARRPDGRYDIDLLVSARKVRADGAGNETEAPLDALIDVGVLDAAGNALLVEKRPVRSGENRFRITVAGEPAKAGVDPLAKLIDRDTGDNVVSVDR
ncbi:MAG TPA: ABC transporter permease [Albitalea sp.]|uniref:ABC transporter permease n=1 Tax=Piscinibacter sp. TaxID=1903157 RepID=UPI002ED08BC0